MSKRSGGSRFWLVVAAVAVIGAFGACGSESPTPTPTLAPTSTPVPGATATPTPTPEPTVDMSFEAQWAQLIADAQAEGELVLSLGGTDSRHLRDTLTQFQRKFDIRVIASTGSGSANTTRILAERSRGRYTADFQHGGISSTRRMIEAGALTPVAPLIIDPTIFNRTPETWHLSHKVWWSDAENLYSMADALSIDNFDDLWYNTDKLSAAEAAEITSWHDLTDPKWAGEIVTTGLATRGSGATARVRAWLGAGPDFLEGLMRNAAVGNNVLDFSDYRQCAELLARGAVTFAYGCDRDARPLAAAGLPLAAITDDVIMEEGLSVEVGGTGSVIDRAPHPKAAQLYINWWYSQDGMETDINYTRNLAPAPKLRSDVGQGKVLDTEWRRVGELQGLVDRGLAFVIDSGTQEYSDVSDQSREAMIALYNELGIIFTP